MDDSALNQLVSVRLCRFCGEPASALWSFVQACNCQGPNSAVHTRCLGDWIAATHATKCDVCRCVYHVTTSDRGLLEWYLKCGAKTGDLWSMAELVLRLANIAFITVLSVAIVGRYSDGLWPRSIGGVARLEWQTTLAWAIVALCVLRLAGVCWLLSSYAPSVWHQFQQWRVDNPKVHVAPNPNFRPLASPVPDRSAVRVAGLRNRDTALKLLATAKETAKGADAKVQGRPQ